MASDDSRSQQSTVKSTASEPVAVAMQPTDAYPAVNGKWAAAEGIAETASGNLAGSVESKNNASAMVPS